MHGKEPTHGKSSIKHTEKSAARQWKKPAHDKESTHDNGKNQRTAKNRSTTTTLGIAVPYPLPCNFGEAHDNDSVAVVDIAVRLRTAKALPCVHAPLCRANRCTTKPDSAVVMGTP
jgi:hypothetical protein